MKKIVITVITFIMLFTQIASVYADEGNNPTEWYEMVEEDFEVVGESNENLMPYTAYIVDVITSMAKISSGKLGLRADVLCSSTMQSIRVTFYLQKKSGSSWVTVASKESSSSYSVSRATKQMTVSGLSSGTYRTKAVAYVQDNYGYSESLTGYSGSLSI